MRTIDESFQRVMSLKYGYNSTNNEKSKSIFEALDDCDRQGKIKKLKESAVIDEGKFKDTANQVITGLSNGKLGKTYEVSNSHGAHQFRTQGDAEQYAAINGGKVDEISNKEVNDIRNSKEKLHNKYDNKGGSLSDIQQTSDMLNAADKVKAARKTVADYGEDKGNIELGFPKNYTGNESLTESVHSYEELEKYEGAVQELLNDLIKSDKYKDLPENIQHEFEGGSMLDEFIEQYAKTGKIDASKYDHIDKWALEAGGRALVNLVSDFYDEAVKKVQDYLDSALKATNESLSEADSEIEVKSVKTEAEAPKVSEEDEKDFEDRIWQKLPSAVKQSLNDAWDNQKTNEKFFEIYLQALVDTNILDDADRDAIIKSNEAYGYTDKKLEALQEGTEDIALVENDEILTEDSKALSKDELCKKWGCAPEDFDAMCAEGSGNLAEPEIN